MSGPSASVLVALLSVPLPGSSAAPLPAGSRPAGAVGWSGAGPGRRSGGACGVVVEGLEGVPGYPPCFEVELAADATGRPPLLYSWTLPGGEVLAGNPVVVDTGLLPFGYQEIVVEVSNDAGSDLFVQPLVVERLGFVEGPEVAPVEGTTVAAVANTRGATEWRWSWGDGVVTGWLEGCAGYRPTHPYAAPGTYTVRVEARSCREGPVSMSGTLVLGDEPVLAVERFEAVCPGTPFCSVEVGEVVGFETVVSGEPEAYLYDWDGDGVDDEVSEGAVARHAFGAAGYFTPRVTVVAGTASDSLEHGGPIEVSGGEGLLFDHGFESGDLSGWEVW